MLLLDIFLCLLLFSVDPYAQIIQDEEDEIYWSETNKLKWEDFQGTPSNVLISNNRLAEALTTYRIKYIIKIEGNILSYIVENVLIKSESWHTSDTTNLLLIHEQTHFDIAELYSRKIKQSFSKLENKGIIIKDFYNIEYDNLYQELRDFVEKYDIETDYGNIETKQLEWYEKVKNELEKLTEFQAE